MYEVDLVELLVLVDDQAGPWVRGLLGEHGLSVLVRVVAEGYEHLVLLDAGQSGDVLLRNAELLGARLDHVEAVVLSHGHYDHTGGLLKLLDVVKARPVVVHHPGLWRPQMYIRGGPVKLDIGPPYPKSAVEGKCRLLPVKSVLEVAPGVYYLGEVPRETRFEEAKGFYTLDADGRLVEDPMLDDTGLAVAVKGVGLVVVAGCSHSGIVNMVSYASRELGVKPYMVLGGLHLAGASGERIALTVKALRELGVRLAHVGHCTGLRAELAFMEAYGPGFARITSGHVVRVAARRG